MMVYDSDSTHLCSSDSGVNLFIFSRDLHVGRHINILYNTGTIRNKSLMPTCTWYKV